MRLSGSQGIVQRYLRNYKTGQYWSQSGWVADPDQAKKFLLMADALQVFCDQHLQDTELILQFGPETREEYDLRFNLSGDYRRPPDLRIELPPEQKGGASRA